MSGAVVSGSKANFAGYEQNKIVRLGPDAARPHAATHRTLTVKLTEGRHYYVACQDLCSFISP